MTEQHLTLRIEDMDCADCALKLEKGVHTLNGVTACTVSFATARMNLVYDPALVEMSQVARRVRAMGYSVAAGSQPGGAGHDSWLVRLRSHPRDAMTYLAGLLLLLAAGASLARLPQALVNGLLAASIALGGVFIFRKAWSSVRYNRELDINVLMTLAVVGALLIGEWAEAAVVVFLFSLGEALEGYTMDRARNAIRSLMSLAPAEATVLRPCLDCAGHLGRPLPGGGAYEGGPCPWCEPHEMAVPVEELAIGEVVLARPGERIPMDGVVLAGHSAVNQAPITGESLPVDKAPGDEIFAGSINGSGALELHVTRLAADNTLSRLIHMVEQAQAQKAPAQRWIDRFARVYTPAVVAIAAAVAVLPPLLFGQPLLDTASQTGWLYRSLTLLVIACPCALVISTPVSIVSAISAAARHGVLVKGGVHLETLARVRVVAFDKTGTLTVGRPVLTGAQCTAHAAETGETCAACDDVLALAAAVERRSEHPLATAVVQAAEARSLNGRYAAAEDVEALAGQGVRGQVNGQHIGVSSHRHIHELAAARRRSHPRLFGRSRPDAAGQRSCGGRAESGRYRARRHADRRQRPYGPGHRGAGWHRRGAGQPVAGRQGQRSRGAAGRARRCGHGGRRSQRRAGTGASHGRHRHGRRGQRSGAGDGRHCPDGGRPAPAALPGAPEPPDPPRDLAERRLQPCHQSPFFGAGPGRHGHLVDGRLRRCRRLAAGDPQRHASVAGQAGGHRSPSLTD